MKRFLSSLVALSISTLAIGVFAQAPAFEVVSVKLNTSANPSGNISGATPGRFTMSGVPLLFIVNLRVSGPRVSAGRPS